LTWSAFAVFLFSIFLSHDTWFVTSVLVLLLFHFVSFSCCCVVVVVVVCCVHHFCVNSDEKDRKQQKQNRMSGDKFNGEVRRKSLRTLRCALGTMFKCLENYDI
jgi:hypothetical protein